MNTTAVKPDARKLKYELNQFIDRLNKNYGDNDTHLFGSREWKARGEEYGNRSTVVITTEGTLYEALWDGNEAYQDIEKEFRSILDRNGFWMEPAYKWMLCIQPKGQ